MNTDGKCSYINYPHVKYNNKLYHSWLSEAVHHAIERVKKKVL